MISTFIILFREVLEISIILSIILAATRGVHGRTRWVWMGVAGGVAGSTLVALFADGISQAIEGTGQEVFNALVLMLAVVMITWTVVWMKRHARHLTQKIKQVGKAVSKGELPLYSLAVVVALSMWREGAEIVLFMAGILSTSPESLLAIMLGGAAGAAAAAAIGGLLYFGLITLSMKHLFSVTGWLLVLLACGMSAQAASYLAQAGLIPDLAPAVWDTSAILSQESLPGRILNAMLGYTDRPSGMQLAWYVTTFAVIVGLLRLTRSGQGSGPAGSAKAVPGALMLLASGAPLSGGPFF